MNISPARIAAFEILSKIESEKAYSSVLLPIYEEKLETQDRALCHELTLGTLRKQIYLDRLIEKLTSEKKLDSAVRIILRIALYQLIFLDKIPAHAAINDAVNLVQKAGKSSAKGFVNAVLRRFTREKIELNFVDQIEKVAVETSHPRWLIEKWIQQFGLTQTELLAAANNETPKLDFRLTAKTSQAVEQSLQRENIENEKNYLRELAANGKIYFQDKGSQMIAEAVDLQRGESFLDVCCAPASKFSMINYLIGGAPQTLFVGGDLYLSRLKIANQNCARTGAKNCQTLVYDAAQTLPFAAESFAVILLDAPCSGTGTIRHNPEIRYFLDKSDFRQLAHKQLQILKNASKVLKRGGRLIYSTCSLEVEENEQVVERFLVAEPEFQTARLKLPQHLLTETGFARTFPQRDKTDGFFVALLEKQ